MVCESVSRYMCNMEMYWCEGKKLEGTVLSLLDRNLGKNHNIHQDNFYNSDISSNIARQKRDSLLHCGG
jgi:hypothetical protein